MQALFQAFKLRTCFPKLMERRPIKAQLENSVKEEIYHLKRSMSQCLERNLLIKGKYCSTLLPKSLGLTRRRTHTDDHWIQMLQISSGELIRLMMRQLTESVLKRVKRHSLQQIKTLLEPKHEKSKRERKRLKLSSECLKNLKNQESNQSQVTRVSLEESSLITSLE